MCMCAVHSEPERPLCDLENLSIIRVLLQDVLDVLQQAGSLEANHPLLAATTNITVIVRTVISGPLVAGMAWTCKTVYVSKSQSSSHDV